MKHLYRLALVLAITFNIQAGIEAYNAPDTAAFLGIHFPLALCLAYLYWKVLNED